MQPRTSFIILALSAAVFTSWLAGCQPDATARAKEAKNWIDKFYIRYSIRGQWGFFGAEAKDKNVIVEINVPEQQTKELMHLSEPERKRFIAHNTCPPRSEEVWSILEVDGDIIIHTRLNGNPFAEVACRNNM